jgi:putative addiction module killer protein
LEAIPREIEYLEDSDGHCPFQSWLAAQTPATRGLILFRLRKVGNGNFGDIKYVGGKVYELRFTEGPGWRVYIAQKLNQVFVLGGGTKNGQQRDIQAAQDFWSDYGD